MSDQPKQQKEYCAEKFNKSYAELEQCDIIMKGGVASGLVFPSAILELAQKYRICSVAGSSAGAIAAAGTAAAEYARRTGHGGNGYNRFRDAQMELGEEGRLLKLFAPADNTRALFNILRQTFQTDKTSFPGRLGRFSWALPINLPGWALFGALVGAIFWRVLAWMLGANLEMATFWRRPAIDISLLVFAAFFGWLGGIGGMISRGRREITRNCFGLCLGSGAKDRLTDWFTTQFDRIACLDEGQLLTFKMLDERKVPEVEALGDNIELKMMTTNLSEEQPYVLPFKVDAFFFEENEWRKLFPTKVMDYLIANSPERREVPGGPPVNGAQTRVYYRLPPGNQLPVVVAVRMSLSFPLLISAVPLYTKDRDSAKEFHRHLFSDGGITSDFPIHFFDSWFPTRPTFGINLMDMPKDVTIANDGTINTGSPTACGGQAAANARVVAAGGRTRIRLRSQPVMLPRADEIVPPDWNNIDGLLSFASSILFTGKNWHDNVQAQTPSYRDRVVQVRLEGNIGDLNLNMNPEQVQTLINRGTDAGLAFVGGNSVEFPNLRYPKFSFEHHQWVRYRVIMATLETLMGDRAQLNSNYDEALRLSIAQLGDVQFPYREQCPFVLRSGALLGGLKALNGYWQPKDLFRVQQPEHAPDLRIIPRL